MRRPPLWMWALPAAVAVGLLAGVRLQTAAVTPAAVPVAVAPPSAALTDSTQRPSIATAPDTASAEAGAATGTPPADSLGWGVDGGTYQPLDPAVVRLDTLPAAPAQAVVSAEPGGVATTSAAPAPPPNPPPVAAAGPAQELSREAAFSRPLIVVARAGGRLSFYSAWDAPAARMSLAGEWAAVGACSPTLRLAYEQAAPGLGAVRGAGVVDGAPLSSVALALPRQHCASGAARWMAARPPRGDEPALLAAGLRGETPTHVVRDGVRIWAASRGRVMVGRVTEAGELEEEWSAPAPEGATARLLGVWEGDGVFVAMESGGRVGRVWRVPG